MQLANLNVLAYGKDSVSFDHTQYNPVEFRTLMLNTRILLGVNHGGLASNLFFVSPHAKVIDFMLYDLYAGVEMPWFTSSLRNLEYIRIYEEERICSHKYQRFAICFRFV